MEFYSCFHIREDTRQSLFTDKMEFHVIELPKLPQELKDDKDTVLLWAKFISSERKEEFEMLASKNTYIQSAYSTLQVISQDEQKRMEYESREKALWDYNQLMLEAKEKGWEEGKREGIEEGEYRKAIQTAQKMLVKKLDLELIAEVSGLSIMQVQQLQSEGRF